MIQESYAECLVKRRAPAYAMALKILLAAGVALAACSLLVIGLFGFLALIVMCLVAARVLETLQLEYEYLFVDRRFSVDKILKKTRRKKEAEYALEDIQVIGPEHAGKVKDWERQVKRVADYTSGRPEANRYAFICKVEGSYEKVIFEPDEKMLRCLKMAAPGKMTEY